MSEYDSIVAEDRAQQKVLAPDDSYDGIVADQKRQQDNALAASLRQAVPVNPDQAAKVSNLSTATGVPPDVISRNEDTVATLARVRELQGMLATSPVLAQQMTNPEFAKLAHDDAENLSAFEDTIKASRGPAVSVGSVLKGLGSFFVEGARTLRANLRLQFADLIGSEDMRKQALRERAQAQSALALSTPEIESKTGSLVYGGAENLLQNAPGLIAAILTRKPSLGIAPATLQTEAEGYGKTRERGGSAGASALSGGLQGAVEAATEFIPMHFLVNSIGKTTLLKLFAGDQLREQFGEQIATHMQDAIDTAIANPTMTWGDYWKQRPDAALQTAVAVLMQGALVTGGAAATGAYVSADRAAQAQRAEQHAGMLKELMSMAGADKLRERSMPSFAQFAQSVADASPTPAVFVDAKTFAQAAQEKGLDIATAMPETAKQLAQAIATDGDVRIPLGEMTAALPGTGLDEALLPHMRTSIDAPTLQEVQDQSHAAETEARVAQIMAQQTFDEQHKASALVVEKELLAQLKEANRFRPDVNGAYAKLAAAFYTVQAARLGITPEEMYVKYPLHIASEGQGGSVMDQPAYHGSPFDFDQFSVDHIGTGEGAQSYGHGLYFAENPGIAQSYHESLAGSPEIEHFQLGPYTVKSGEKWADYSPRNNTDAEQIRAIVTEHLLIHENDLRAAHSTGKLREHVLAQIDGFIKDYWNDPADAHLVEAAKKFRKMMEKKNAIKMRIGKAEGGVYTVDIPDEHVANMLNWDKPLSEQPASVQAALATFFEKNAPDHWAKVQSDAAKGITYTGEALYHDAEMVTGSPEQASKELLALGIPGIKYADAGSRTMSYRVYDDKGNVLGAFNSEREAKAFAASQPANIKTTVEYEGTHNLVVFDDKIINITHKDGKPLTPQQRNTLAQETIDNATGQPDEAPAFYSVLSRQIQAAKMKVAPAEQWKAFIKGLSNKGVKKEEIEVSGVMDWLDIVTSHDDLLDKATGQLVAPEKAAAEEEAGNPLVTFQDNKLVVREGYEMRPTQDRVTKQDVLDYLAGNHVKVETTILGEPPKPGTAVVAARTPIASRGDYTIVRTADGHFDIMDENDEPFIEGQYTELAEAQQAVTEAVEHDNEGDTEVSDEDVERRAEELWREDLPEEARSYASEDEYTAVTDPYIRLPTAHIVELPADMLRPGEKKFGVQLLDWDGDASSTTDREELDEAIQNSPPKVDWATQEEFPTRVAAEAWAGENVEDFYDGEPYFTARFENDDANRDEDDFGQFDSLSDAKSEARTRESQAYEDSVQMYMDSASYGDQDTSYWEDRARRELEEEAEGPSLPRWRHFDEEDANATPRVRHDKSWQSEGGRDYRELILSIPTIEPYNAGDSTHFQTDTGGRTIAWVRAKIHDDAEGVPTLFLEEVQSQRAQAGREEGFKGLNDDAEYQAADAAYNEASMAVVDRIVERGYANEAQLSNAVHGDANGIPAPQALAALEELQPLITARDAARERRSQALAKQRSMVPSAPFVRETKAWTALALKRALRYAVDHGLTQIAWTTATEQVDRYQDWLRKNVDSILWKKVEGGIEIDAQKSGQSALSQKFTEKELHNVIGAEMAQTIINDPEQAGRLSGRNLAIDDIGMAGYYGNEFGENADGKPAVLPLVANKLSKDLGGAGVLILPLATEEKGKSYEGAAGIIITPEMRDKIVGGLPLFQSNRGLYNLDSKTITLLEKADLSTFVHEMGHFQLDVMADMASQAEAPPEVVADMDALLKWFGVADLPTWNAMDLEAKRSFHEQLARGFESYMFEGKAPSQALNGVFARIRAWMMHVYQALTSLNVTLTPEVRAVFDRMIATNDEIVQAEAARGYKPLYASAAEMGASEEEWNAYQEQQQSQTQEAVDQLQGRSLRDMQWLTNAKSRVLRALQRDAKAKRQVVQAEVAEEVRRMKVYAAQQFLRHGVFDEAKLTNAQRKALDTTAGGSSKLNLTALKEMYGEGPAAPWRYLSTGKTGLATAQGGIHPDIAANVLGYGSGDQLVRSVLDAEPEAHVVEAMTDQRMLERHGDLSSPDALNRAVDEALANEAHLKMLATELRFAEKAVGKRITLVQAAKEFAASLIASKRVKEISPAPFAAAEGKAQKAAQKAHLKGDRKAVADAKRAQVVNAHAVKLAYQALDEIRKGITYQARFDKKGTRDKLDIDIRDQIDDLRERFDFRKKVPTTPTRAEVNLQKWIESQQAAGYAPMVTPDMLNQALRMHYADMTMEQFRGFIDTLKSLEHIGRQRRQITLAGQKLDLNEYVAIKLVPKLEARGVRFSKGDILDRAEDRHTNPIAIALDHFRSWLRGAAAQLKPQEFKRNEYDRHELLGPFGESIFDPVINANYNKNTMLKALSDDFGAMAETLGREWQDSLRNSVANIALADPDKSEGAAQPVMMNFTRGKMIGLAIHVGNESNFDKVTKGWGWEPTAVWKFLHTNMSGKDWQAVQAVWDLYEKHWPEMEAMNRRLGNTSPDKVAPRPFKTQFGDMRGGYAAITYDPLRSRRGEKEASGEAINPAAGLFGRNYFRADTTTNGSMNKRVDSYTDRVDLDYHGIARKLNETIHDLAYREVLIDTNKIVEHSAFRKAFRAAYGKEAYRSMQDWLGQLANSNNFDRTVGALGKFLQYTRTGMVINAIAFRASTVLKHGGSAGIKTTGYFLGGGEKYLASRFASMGTDYSNQISGAVRKFGEIRNRLLQQDRDFRVASTSMFEPDSALAKAERFGHAAVAWSDMMTAVPTAWAAYDRAVAEGIPVNQGGTGQPMTEAQAIAYANKIVREAHGTTAEAARSMVLNAQSEGMKMFTTLYGFMNNSYGQQLDGFDKLRTAGISNAVTLARTFMAVIVPALWAGFLSHRKKDDESWAAWVAKAIAGEVAASVPFVRDAYGMVEGWQHAGMVAAENWLAEMVLAGKDIVHVVEGDTSKGAPVKDIANAVGTGLHIPGLGQLGASLQYVANVAKGKEHPKSTSEFVEGVVLGHAPKP